MFSVGNTFEGGSQSDLGFAETHITAKKSVHGVRLFHILFDFVDASYLVVCFVIFKTSFKIVLHINIGGESVALGLHSSGIKFDKFFRHILGGGFNTGFHFFPVISA